MRSTLLAGLAMAGLVACGKGTSQSAADSARSVELAKADSNYRLGDRPASSPAPSPSPSPAPAPSPSRKLTLGSGTRIDATTQRSISSRNDNPSHEWVRD